jgi:allantoinase
MVVSDHSPAPPEMKTAADAFEVWGGISGCQSLLPIVVGDGHREHGLPLEHLADLLAGFAARRFRLPGKGRLEAGADADLVLVDLAARDTLDAAELQYRHRHSPYAGRTMRARVDRTIVRGATVFAGGAITAEAGGRLITPDQGGRR